LTRTRTDAARAEQRARADRVVNLIAEIETRLLADLEHARQDGVAAALWPYAAPRLPDEILACFDAEQRQFRPLPAQAAEYARRRSPGPLIPLPREPAPGEVRPRVFPR
jgi:uncharacterized protein YdeI (YjbR/CyaY-like superfamily)